MRSKYSPPPREGSPVLRSPGLAAPSPAPVGAAHSSTTTGSTSGSGSADSERKRHQLLIAAARLRSVTAALVVTLAALLLGHDLVLHADCRRALRAAFIADPDAVVIGNTVSALASLAALPAAILLDGFLLPKHGLTGALVVGVLCLAVLCAAAYPSDDDDAASVSQRRYLTAVTTMALVFFALAFGMALYILCVVMANVREKALRIQRTVELSLTSGIPDADGASRRVQQWVETDGFANRHHQHHHHAHHPQQQQQPTNPIAAAIAHQSLFERAVWFADGPMSLYVLTSIITMAAIAAASLVLRPAMSVFQSTALATCAGATALVVLAAVGRALPKTLSALPTIDELLHFRATTAPEGGAANSSKRRPRTPLQQQQQPRNVTPVYAGSAAFQVLWRRLVGEDERALVAVYGEHLVHDAVVLVRVGCYSWPLLLQAVAARSLLAALEGIATRLAATHPLDESYGTNFVVWVGKALGGGVAIALFYVSSRWLTRAFVSDVDTATSTPVPSSRNMAQSTASPRVVAAWGYLLTTLAAAALMSLDALGVVVVPGTTPWVVLPFAAIGGAGSALAFASNAALLWSSIAPSLRVFSLALLWTAIGFGPVGSRWAPWHPGDTAAIAAHAIAAAIVAALAVVLHLVLMRRHQGQIIDEGALIGRDITPDWGEDAFVLEGRLGATKATQPGSLLRRAAKRSTDRHDLYGATEMA